MSKEVVMKAGRSEPLANALRFEKEKNKVLLDEVLGLEDELVNRKLAEFESLIGEDTKDFWREQLLGNRTQAETALKQLAALQSAGRSVRARPLHNRATARPMQPNAAGGTSSTADHKAVLVRNRAHELKRTEGIPFAMAFRRAEAEIVGQG